MSVGEKEIAWELLQQEQFMKVFQRAVGNNVLEKHGISFPSMGFGLNVNYDNPSFKPLLRQKFELNIPHENAPCLTLIRNHGHLGINFPCKHHGYVSEDMSEAIVFASSFGMFKSTISGYASLFMEHKGYVPAHASVLSVNGKGILLTGGSSAGKTTTMLNLVDWLLKSGESVGILTDDWAIIASQGDRYIAESFDPSVSLRQKTIDENPHLRFHYHEDLLSAIAMEKKVSLSPNRLYGQTVGVEKVSLGVVVLLLAEEGDGCLQEVDHDVFAKVVVDAAYHYPYVSAKQIHEHEAFWMQLALKLPIFAFATRGYDDPSQSINGLKELVYGK